MFRSLSTICIFLIISSYASSQSKIDSLKQVLDTTKNDSLKIHTYLHLRNEYHRTDPQVALEYTLKAEQIAKKANLKTSLAEAIFRKGTVLFSMRRYEEAEKAFDEAMAIFSELNDERSGASVKVELARLFKDQSKIESALYLYLEALPVIKEAGDKNAEARIYNYLAGLYKVQKQYDKAIENYQLALSLVKELNIVPGISACLTNLAGIYNLIGKYDLAISYNDEALKLKYETGDKLGASRVLNNLGIVHNNLQQYDRAESYFEQAHLLATQYGDAQLIAAIEYGLVVSTFHKGDFKQSIKMSNSVLAGLDSLPNLELAVKVHRTLSQAYQGVGEFENALVHAFIHSSLSDSLYNERILSITSNVEARYQSEQKGREIELQALQIQKAENERNFLIVLAITIFLIAGLVYYQNRIKQKANAKLKELDRLKSDFFANISHEFRTPLSLIMAPLKEDIEQAENGKEKRKHEMMYRNADHLFNLINQLLDLSKLEHGKIKLQKSTVDISHFFKIIAASFSSLAEYKIINFKVEIPDEEHQVEFDQDIIQKICYNLLSNAFKFTSKGGDVYFTIALDKNSLKIIVKDSGSGIPVEDREKVFDRFFQSSNERQLGTGIGLALSKELVQLHQGTINLESANGQGSTFAVEIPVSKPAKMVEESWSTNIENPQSLHSYSPKDTEQLNDASKPIILIIEDNQDLRNYLDTLLGDNFTIHQTKDGLEGIAKAKEIIPDLIISDVMMPSMDGIEVCSRLKKEKETDHIPIILLTARADQESKLKGLTTGADDYLSKPFDPKELKVRVSNLLRQRNNLREKYTQLLLLKPADIQINSKEASFLKTVIEVVNEHLHNSTFDTEQFCSEVAMSRMQLHRKLTALTGHSATAFVRHQRLVRASQLLESGEPVSQVAYAVGFGSLSYFTRAFKEEFGRVPSEYASSHDQES